MAKIKLSEGGFNLIPEGTYVFKITAVEYKEDFGKMKVSMQTKDGKKHTEQFTMLTDKGEINQGAVNAFSYFAKTALNNYELDEIDDQDLVSCYIKATVTHEDFEYTRGTKKGQTGKNARLNDWAVATSFESAGADPEDDDLDDLE